MKLLSIVSISHGHASLLRENLALATEINGDLPAAADWYVGENSVPTHSDRLVGGEPGFIVRAIDGERGKGISHHHATALNALLHTVEADSRYVMILDPDYFIVFPDWVRAITRHMERSGLSFFGTPWHPRHHEHYRFFPAVHCFVFDQQRVPASQLDFTPILDHLHWLDSPVAQAINRFPLIGWRLLRRSWDTGSRVFEEFHERRRFPSDCVVPVVSERDEMRLSPAWIEELLPDRWCIRSRQLQTVHESEFFDNLRLDEPLPTDWECFMWRDQPFGLHVRRSYSADRRDAIDEMASLRRTLRRIVSARP